MNRVGIVGLGYVGLTLAVTLARRGFTVHGADTSPDVLQSLRAGRPHLYEPGIAEALTEHLGVRLHVDAALTRMYGSLERQAPPTKPGLARSGRG